MLKKRTYSAISLVLYSAAHRQRKNDDIKNHWSQIESVELVAMSLFGNAVRNTSAREKCGEIRNGTTTFRLVLWALSLTEIENFREEVYKTYGTGVTPVEAQMTIAVKAIQAASKG